MSPAPIAIHISDDRGINGSRAIMVGDVEVPWDGGNVDVYVGNILRYTVEFYDYTDDRLLDTTTHALWDGESPVYEVKEHNDPDVWEDAA